MTIGLSIERWFAGAVALAVAILGLLGAPVRTAASPSPKPSKTVAVPAFVAPPGWHHAQGTSDGLGTWLRPGDTGYSENITVEAKDGVGSLDSLFTAEMAYIRGFPDVFGYAPTDTTVCGNHPAKYVSYTYTSPTGLPVTSEVVIAVFGTTGYSARYSKSISQDADTAAERSLLTLCGRSAHPAEVRKSFGHSSTSTGSPASESSSSSSTLN